MYRVQQFAKIANVTVRTLHHYDRLGLLSPSLRSASGYRLYRMEDLEQLERIRLLRYLGLPLREIRELLAADGPHKKQTLHETLTRQASILRKRRDGIDRVLRGVERAQHRSQGNSETDWSLYQNILKEIEMQEKQDWIKKYYSPEAQRTLAHGRVKWSPELQARITADWQTLFAEVQSALERHVDPVGAEGKALATRWMELVAGFTQGDPEVEKGLRELYADRANWPAEQGNGEVRDTLPRPEYMAFVQAALEN